MPVATSISEFCASRGVPFSTITHPTAYTAQEEAAVSHIPGRLWAKTVVCYADAEPLLAVLPAHYTVDLERLRLVASAQELRLATEDEMVSLYLDCEAGAMPPLGPLYGQRVFVDRSLTADPEIVFNAGTHSDAIQMKYGDFAALVSPTIGDFGIRPGH